MVLGGRPDQRRAADVDLLDQRVERDPGSLGRRLERVEVDHDELERGDARRDQLLAMVRAAAVRQDPRVDPRVERLDPAVEHLGDAGDGRDVGDREAGRSQRGRRATGCHELEAELDELARERFEAGPVGRGKQGAPRRRQRAVRQRRVDDRGAAHARPERARTSPTVAAGAGARRP